MKLIISGTDGFSGAESAVAFAADLAKSCNAKLLIVYVSEDKLSHSDLNLLERLRVSEGDALEEISGRNLSRARVVAQEHGASNIELMGAAGDPTQVLIGLAKSKNADAVAVGRRGRGQLEGLLLGSVSQKLSCLAPCSVIVVPRSDTTGG